ncbi:hypothetical protein Ddye_009516 [Dipteronia dyeriana]|uniref:Uncharacterized protein n=1 Tax=Dipteronia dyeriana TaxID=168575 RepID=A0AAD9XBK1_9ROSI|nr:hypothetical protein Ddye_009516 [Dipteronia dyeriana]
MWWKRGRTNENWVKAFWGKYGSLPITYLVLPLGGRPCEKDFWKLMESRIDCRLAPCNKKFLNKSGRLVLIKVVVASILIYFMFVFKIPIRVAQNVERLQKNSFLGDDLGEKKLNMVSWEIMCKAKANDGLGIAIESLYDKVSNSTMVLNDGLKVKVRKGDKASFWKDIRCEESPLKLAFPRIFAFETKKLGPIIDFGRWLDGN